MASLKDIMNKLPDERRAKIDARAAELSRGKLYKRPINDAEIRKSQKVISENIET